MVENKKEAAVEETQKEEQPSTPSEKPCATPDCSKIATMQCPTCIKLSLEPTFFCGQECFTGFWKFHKLAHKKPETGAKADSGIYTGPLRPHKYGFTGRRSIPDHIKKPDYAKTGQPN